MSFNPWMIAVELGLTVGLDLMQRWMSDPPPDDRRSAFSTYPSTAEGTPLPIVYGRTRVRQPVVPWYGVQRVRPAKDFGGLGLDGDAQLQYGLSMLFIVGIPCGPVDDLTGARLLAIYDGDRKYPMNLAHGETLQLFGAQGIGGQPPTLVSPFFGTVQFFGGRSTQLISNNAANNSALPPDAQVDITEIARFMRWESAISPNGEPFPLHIPGYRNQMLVALSGDHAVPIAAPDSDFLDETLDSFYFGPSPTVPRFSFEVICQRSAFGTAKLDNGDECPATVIADVITRSWAKLGLPTSGVDTVSFTAAAVTLLAEGNGISCALDTQRDAKQFLQEVLNQIAGVLYYDPVDGLIHLKLMREDYDVATIPRFDQRHVLRDPVPTATVGGAGVNTINRATVRFTDRASEYNNATSVTFNQAGAIVADTGSGTGRVRTAPIEYPYVSNLALARSLAQRDLKLLSYPLTKLRLKLNRLPDLLGTTNATMLRPGDVFRLSFPDHHIGDQVFRVVKPDPGQLGDSGVIVDAVLDIFRAGTSAYDPPVGQLFFPVPMPLANRVLTEAPRWAQLFLTNLGTLTNPDVQRILAVARPDDDASRFRVIDRPTGPGFLATDLSSRQFSPSATVAAAYGAELEPFDDSIGLIVTNFVPNDNVAAAIFAQSFTPTQIANSGFTLIYINGEILAFELSTDLGGSPKQWRLDNVWRGLLDTRPRAHSVGDIAYFIGFHYGGQLYVGNRGWSVPSVVLDAIMMPELGVIVSSGGDPVDRLTIRKRCVLPPRLADFGITGKNIVGTIGTANTRIKTATRLEEALNLHASRRDRLTGTIIRGDGVDETQNEVGIGYTFAARKGTATAVDLVTLNNAAAIDGTSSAAGLLLGVVGHGAIDVIATTKRTVQPAESGIGFPSGTIISSWDAPVIPVVAPRWRNLLANSRFDYGAITPGWTQTGPGTISVDSNTTTIPRDTTGFYVREATRSAIVEQTVTITGYLPRKMSARLVYYQRNLSADANDTVQATLDPLDATSVTLGGAATVTGTAPTTSWQRKNITIASLPALTDKLKVSFGWNEIAGGGTGVADVGITEAELIVGQHLYDVLANPSFETASTASWTNVTNSFVTATTVASPSANYAQGGAFAASEIRQDYTLLTGWEVGTTMVLRMWRAQTIANDTGNVVLEALDGSSNVLATTSTGAQNLSTLNQWVRRTLDLVVPVGSVTIRVRLVAVRTGGAGNSGALFDELVLSPHKTLDASYERVLDFSAPSVQLSPRTWQEWYLAYPTLTASLFPPVVFAASLAGASVCTASSIVIKTRWADDVNRAAGKLVGQFGAGIASIDGYRFTRQSGVNALDYQTFGEDTFRFASPRTETSFTALVLFRIDEIGFATACGLCGRRDTNSGWELGVDATGHVTAAIKGTGSTITATRPATTVHDGALHLAAVVYDAVANTLTVYDERGGTSVSTVGVGEIANTTNGVPFRLGRARTSHDTLPGFIGRMMHWGETLDAAQVATHWTYGKDPNGTALAYTRSVAAWCPGAVDVAGETLACMATDQIAIGRDADLETDGGTGFGLASVKATTNLAPSFDMSNGTFWTADASSTITQSIVDATGKPNGVTVLSPNVTNGLKLKGITVGATATVNVVFWARAATGTPTIALELQNGVAVVKDTQTKVLDGGTLWKRYVVGFVGWDASTATCIIRWRSNAGSTTFDLTHVLFVAQGTEIPALIPFALAAIGDVTASLAETPTIQLNAEGEVVAVGVATIAAPGQASIANVKNNTNSKNRRELQIGAAQVPRFDHYDSVVPTSVTSSGTAVDWSLLWTVRGRWCALGTLDNAANAFAGVVTVGSASSANYGRAATWTYDATADQVVQLGAGAQPAWNGYLRSLTVRARESKLP
ncbi:MAG: LamG-like jellyroll fold domain-containing protein [Pseudolysinimonas sp.]